MKKIAAVAVAGVLTAGVTAISQPADAYAIKPSLCQILGAAHSANPVRIRYGRLYPTQFFVKAPGVFPTGSVRIAFAGAASGTYNRPLSGGTTFTRISVKPGTLKVTLAYGGANGVSACHTAWSTKIIKY